MGNSGFFTTKWSELFHLEVELAAPTYNLFSGASPKFVTFRGEKWCRGVPSALNVLVLEFISGKLTLWLQIFLEFSLGDMIQFDDCA